MEGRPAEGLTAAVAGERTEMNRSIRHCALALMAAAAAHAGPQTHKEPPMPQTITRQAADTLTALEMNRGDVLEFTLRSGQVRKLVVGKSAAVIVERVTPGGVVYRFDCRVRIDARAMTLQRYVCSQECFYVPYVVNGMRIWLDAVSAGTDMIPMRKMETQRAPHKHVRLAVQDATLPICPQPPGAWYPNNRNVIDVGDCYNGDDCWLGPYLGKACHGGLDINHPKGDPLWAPIDFDDHWLFNSVAAGHNNNRWRGVRKWPSGDVWTLQTHHLIKLLVPEHTPLKRGTKFATAAGVWVGCHNHTHYVFKVQPARGGPEIHLDPWIVFEAIFDNARAARSEIRAAMRPLAPARTGRPVGFSATGSRAGKGAGKLRYCWTFGDGGFATGPRPTHVFAKPGVWPVTLLVDDGTARAACTQHMTVDGEAVGSPVLALAAADEPSFRPRPVHAMDVYGQAVETAPHTLRFTARPGGASTPAAKTVRLRNLGKDALAPAAVKIAYEAGDGWLRVEATGRGSRQALRVTADTARLKMGRYAATVSVACAGAANSPQAFRVELHVRRARRPAAVTVDDRGPGFYCTPQFWVGHRFCRCKQRGCAGRYLTNGSRPAAGEFARFTPDLAAGRYEVSFHEKTPFRSGARFDVRVGHAGGAEAIRVHPARSRRIGVFDFAEGTDGFVEILAAGSTGLVVADAVVFRPVQQAR